mgnify:CR=1 FL=1
MWRGEVMEKMTIEKAREIVSRFGATKGYIEGFSSVTDVYLKGKFFIEGFESSQAEVEELKKENYELERAYENLKENFNNRVDFYLKKDANVIFEEESK